MLVRKVLVDAGSGRERERFAAALENQEPIEVDGVRCFVTEMVADPLRGTWVYLERPDSGETAQLPTATARYGHDLTRRR